jgi:hypothetical protein
LDQTDTSFSQTGTPHALAFQAEVNRLLAKTQRRNVKFLNSTITEVAKATIPCCSCNHEDWFKMSKKILFVAIQARKKAFSKLSTDPPNANTCYNCNHCPTTLLVDKAKFLLAREEFKSERESEQEPPTNHSNPLSQGTIKKSESKRLVCERLAQLDSTLDYGSGER